VIFWRVSSGMAPLKRELIVLSLKVAAVAAENQIIEGIQILARLRVFEANGKLPNFGNLTLPVSGLYLLAAPSTPDEARAEAIARAEQGEVLSVADVQRIVDDALRGAFITARNFVSSTPVSLRSALIVRTWSGAMSGRAASRASRSLCSRNALKPPRNSSPERLA
jgi:hypothetical protein